MWRLIGGYVLQRALHRGLEEALQRWMNNREQFIPLLMFFSLLCYFVFLLFSSFKSLFCCVRLSRVFFMFVFEV